jgi:hypothetical protein
LPWQPATCITSTRDKVHLQSSPRNFHSTFNIVRESILSTANMGGRQPYLYQPVTHAPFNPKAYTQSLANPTPPQPKPDGPLIAFNRHPDSYDNLPYGKHVNAKLMSLGSKKRIIWARKIQLVWRVLEWIVALAVLVCVVTIKGAPETQGWILRLPVSTLITSMMAVIAHIRDSQHLTSLSRPMLFGISAISRHDSLLPVLQATMPSRF